MNLYAVEYFGGREKAFVMADSIQDAVDRLLAVVPSGAQTEAGCEISDVALLGSQIHPNHFVFTPNR